MARLPMIMCALALSAWTALDAQELRAEQPFYGLGRSKDGDSLMVGNREVRLFGIDAPEFDQTCKRGGGTWTCGTEAADQLSRLVTGRDVRCIMVSVDQYGRSVSRCSVGLTDINAAMVESGFATAYRRYSSDYVAAEARAKLAKRGIWAGTFEAPREYRIEKRTSSSVQEPSRSRRPRVVQSQCNIKGNQNRRGQWIYHLPGMPYYEQTRAEEIFCSEAEAQAAGYRRAIVK